MISRYLDSLGASLRVPPRTRGRILAEVRDHLHEAVAAGLEAGLPASEAEGRALASFGSVEDLAAGFHEQLASSSAHRAAERSTLAVAGVVAVVGAASGSASAFPYGLFVFFGAQIAVVAAALGLACSLRHRSSAIPATRLRDVYRANAIAVTFAAAAALAFGLATRSSTGLLIIVAALLVASAVAARSVAASYSRARVLAPTDPPADDAVDDLLALARQVGDRAARVEGLAVRGARLVHERVPWLDLRRRPWRFCSTFAAACGLAVAAEHGIAEGGISNPSGALLAGLIIAAAEAAAVVISFATLGRYLGIRR